MYLGNVRSEILRFAQPRQIAVSAVNVMAIDSRAMHWAESNCLTLCATQGFMDDDGAGDTLDGVATDGYMR